MKLKNHIKPIDLLDDLFKMYEISCVILKKRRGKIPLTSDMHKLYVINEKIKDLYLDPENHVA